MPTDQLNELKSQGVPYPSPPSPKLRFDRALSIGVMQPAAQMFDHSSGPRIPILMYHGIRPALRVAHPYFETNTSPARFESHIRFLSENGYQTSTLEDFVQAVRSGETREKRVVITFDDGYRDFYTEAFPILTKYNFKATVFVVPGFTGEQPVSRNGEEYMSWREIREVCSNGVSVGSHSMTHPKLYSLPLAQIDEEIHRSKAQIEDKLGVPVRSFAYPFAFPEQDKRFVRDLRSLLQSHGYSDGVCTIIGRAHSGHDTLFLPRIPVNSYDDLRFFGVKLNGGYDWLHHLQYLAKMLKARSF
jgi:peptidoglycan/xylan/chitin deacetylase (PgdA/CDA1 family)